MNQDQIFQNLVSLLPGIKIFKNYPLAPLTTVKLGGPASIFINPQTTSEFISVLKLVQPHPFFILGNGSNVLIPDQGLDKIVIHNDSNSIEYLPNNQVKVDSGVQLPLLINQTVDHSLSGLEEYAYIPSTIGGAIFGNIHGTNKNDFNKLLVSIDIFDTTDQTQKTLNPLDLSWSYDTSEFQQHPNWIILQATLQLNPGDSSLLKQTVVEIISKKSPIQSMVSLGCVFKNPLNDSAGRIIDQELGLKGFVLGGVQVSPNHANFIINTGTGTAADYLALIQKIQQLAQAKGFSLETEIKLLQ
ncbi:MAG TPA: UDP-N-acetylmuramate dehydrogenase [Candidatus Woesebacteria bacterium]|nr:UDP-N-acetylmuramate dehydrogenase [Candidatus Woesebacteria bacterium]